MCIFWENQPKKRWVFYACLKKKSADDRKKLSVFRVFEQKKRCVPVFEPRPIWQHATPAHVDTQAQKKKSEQQLQRQQHAIIILTKSRKVNNTKTINAHHHHFVGATDNRKFFFIICRMGFDLRVVCCCDEQMIQFFQKREECRKIWGEWFERIF